MRWQDPSAPVVHSKCGTIPRDKGKGEVLEPEVFVVEPGAIELIFLAAQTKIIQWVNFFLKKSSKL